MKFNPKVSIIIPVFNGENYVEEAVKSALSQTYKNIEIIVVDDGSTDRTSEVLEKYEKKIRYFKKENGGTSTALNFGIEHMNCEYFSWLSHDDMYYPKKIERQIEELSKLNNKNTIMMSDLDGINEKYEKIYETKYIEHINNYPKREKSNIHPIVYNQTHGCTLLIPKICFKKVGLFDEKELVAQDFEFFYRAFLKFPHKLISEVLVTARDSSNRQGIRSKDKGNVEYSRLFIKIIKNLTDEDYKLLSPSKLEFFRDMELFYEAAGYTIALDYIRKLSVKNIQVSSHDLIGRRFNGHDLHLFLQEKDIDSKQLVLYKQSEDLNTFNYNFFDNLATKKLLTKKILIDSEIIHFHLIHNIFDINYLPILSNMIPTIITLHDCFFIAGHCVHHFDCNKWQTVCENCPYLDSLFPLENDISTLNYMLKYNAIKNSQIAVIVSSNWMMNKVKSSPIWENKKIYHLPFGIDTQKFCPREKSEVIAEFGISKDNFVIFFRAENDEFKGIEIIKETLKEISAFSGITVISVGSKGLLDEFSNTLQVLDMGWVTEESTLIKLYQCCDIFLMPSKQETFGLMALEAMSCGKMVLAIDDIGSALPDIIDSPNCGIATKKEEYTKELCRLIYNKDEVYKRGQNSRRYALKNHKKEDYINGIIKIYNEVINDHSLDEKSEKLLSQLRLYSNNIDVNHDQNFAQHDDFIKKTDPNEALKTISNTKEKTFIVRKLFRIIIPFKVRSKAKDILRPVYHKIKKIINN